MNGIVPDKSAFLTVGFWGPSWASFRKSRLSGTETIEEYVRRYDAHRVIRLTAGIIRFKALMISEAQYINGRAYQ